LQEFASGLEVYCMNSTQIPQQIFKPSEAAGWKHMRKAAELQDDSGCPSWLRDYKAFHAAQRGADNATYLVQYLPARSFSSGLGELVRECLAVSLMAVDHHLRNHWLSDKRPRYRGYMCKEDPPINAKPCMRTEI
jgi:hypothetical protein